MQVYSEHEGEAAGLPPDRFQILALDGGGAKALFTAHILARLEQDLGVSVNDSFDLIAGTSAGGIVALALGAGLAPSEITTHFKSLVETVFPSARRRWWHRPRQLTSPIYDADALRTALEGVLGETKQDLRSEGVLRLEYGIYEAGLLPISALKPGQLHPDQPRRAVASVKFCK
jgi:patatin-like phospholipase/acyl hydrolase